MNQVAALKLPVSVAETGIIRASNVSATAQGLKTMELAPETAVAPAPRAEQARPRTTSRPSDVLFKNPRPVASNKDEQTDSAPKANAASASASVTRTVQNIEIDPATQSVIFQSLSDRTGEIVNQVPSEALLRIREYVRGTESAPQQPTVERNA